MKAERIIWSWEGQEVQVGLDRLGVGPIVLWLPALSSISTRQEMRPLQERLASDFATVAIDWPGFGNEPRPPIPWQPAAYTTFLHYVLTHVATHPLATVACRARRKLCPLGCCCLAELSWDAMPNRPNLAWPLADHNGWTTSGGRMGRPRKRPAGAWPATLPAQRQTRPWFA